MENPFSIPTHEPLVSGAHWALSGEGFGSATIPWSCFSSPFGFEVPLGIRKTHGLPPKTPTEMMRSTPSHG